MRGVAEKQYQRAGADSTQIQVHGDYYAKELSPEQLGLVLDLARAAAAETARLAAAEYSLGAREAAVSRIEVFDERLLEVLSDASLLRAFEDPGFQVLLRKAQVAAASTERVSDYEVLARLLRARAASGERRSDRAALDRAVQIVDMVDDDALVGLTLLVVVGNFTPSLGKIGDGLDAFDANFRDLLITNPPVGESWVYHLELLNAIRINYTHHYNPLVEWLPAMAPGYVCRGVQSGSEVESLIQSRLRDAELNLQLVEHELKAGFKRLPCVSRAELLYSLPAGLTAEQSETVGWVARETGLDSPDRSLHQAFMAAWNQRPHLRQAAEWWARLPQAAPIPTEAGRVMGIANATRLAPSLDD